MHFYAKFNAVHFKKQTQEKRKMFKDFKGKIQSTTTALVDALEKISTAIEMLIDNNSKYNKDPNKIKASQLHNAYNSDCECQIRIVLKEEIFEVEDNRLSRFVVINIVHTDGDPFVEMEIDEGGYSVLFIYPIPLNSKGIDRETISLDFCDIATIKVEYAKDKINLTP